ncbi:MAG TPA: hypothetical protein VGF82_03640, partial [Terracidiphilus sp.]
MRKRNKTDATALTRRTLLGRGLACALASLAPPNGAISGVSGVADWDSLGDLYVFSGARAATTVIAVTWPARFSSPRSEMRIHIGSHCCGVKFPEGESVTRDENGLRLFAGPVLFNAKTPDGYSNAVVLEVAASMFSRTGITGIWAERRTDFGARQRIGSPFLAEIVAGSPSIAALYHSTSPAEDTVVLEMGVAKEIAEKARAGGRIHRPDAYGRRMASILLPDVLHYDPKLPLGFTFAGQNGRHP